MSTNNATAKIAVGDTVTINGQDTNIKFTVVRIYNHSTLIPGYDPEDEDSYVTESVVDIVLAQSFSVVKMNCVAVNAVTSVYVVGKE